jgi:hypothetical protein
VMVGNVSSVAWQIATAGRKTRARQLEFLNTPPRWSVNTRSSRPLLTIKTASSSPSAAGKGTDRRSHVFGVLQTNPPGLSDRTGHVHTAAKHVESPGREVRPSRPNAVRCKRGSGRLHLAVQRQPLSAATGSGGGYVDRSETADVEILLGAPRNAAVLRRMGDRLVIDDSEGFGMRYHLISPRLFDSPNSLTPGGVTSCVGPRGSHRQLAVPVVPPVF